MESDLFNGSLPFAVNFTTLAIALALLLAALAFTRGVIGMFVGLVCLLAGAFVGYSSHSQLPGWLSHVSENPSPRFVFFVAIGIAFSVYVALRLLAGAFLLSPFRREGKKKLVGGLAGAVLSLIPAAALIVVLCVGLRMAGTLFSIEHTQAGVAAEEGAEEVERPFWARWNEALDRDYLGALIAQVDPLAARARGAISTLLVALGEDGAVEANLAENPAAAEMLRNPALRGLAEDPEVSRYVERGEYIQLLRHPKLREVAADPEVRKLLESLQVERAVDSSLYAAEDGEVRRRRQRGARFLPR
jgi:hypothetical protein